MNPDKCHLLFSGFTHEQMFVRLENHPIWEEFKVKLLGVKIDKELKFETHIEEICDKANKKLSVLLRLSKSLDFKKKRLLFKAFFESQFRYCPLVWMMCSRKANNRIDKLHERALRFVYNDYATSFENLLEKDGSVTVHNFNVQTLAIEVYKFLNGFSPEILKDIFVPNSNPYSVNDLFHPCVRTVGYGKHSLSFFGSVIWGMVPREIKSVDSLGQFKFLIRQWKLTNCPCNLCVPYIPQVGFMKTFT